VELNWAKHFKYVQMLLGHKDSQSIRECSLQVAHTNQYPEGDQGQVLPQSRGIQLLQPEIIETPRLSGRDATTGHA
jgi:hypothetical protein